MFLQTEDGIRDAHESRVFGDVYQRQTLVWAFALFFELALRASPKNKAKAQTVCLCFVAGAGADLTLRGPSPPLFLAACDWRGRL